MERNGDLISRQEAINEIGEWIKAFLENGHKESAADARLIQDGIIQLPSTQPEITVDGYADGFADGYKQGKKDVQPEIIRCKDCRYYKTYQYVNGIRKFLPKCSFNDIYVVEDDFCSQAERKQDG